ncbi:cytochrome c and c1 heme-lyase [Terfezia boudieri ATCC MYA-4762]|uniref:Holocytochrome c-type synthase n=1 Tax=Terfezia boudieri ATCC MYA-4762 TaxID=1051890 RepID=A0A3N4LCT9_9PEZI|nr:cytochrome c and c1 heme-lyase [Terfezia boudieri ATCC MYA-4762]
MGWFWADPVPWAAAAAEKPAQRTPAGHPPPSCPMHQSSTPTPPPPWERPMHNYKSDDDHGSSTAYTNTLNPFNLMPNLPSYPIHTDQSVPLPLQRTVSSIPKGATPDAGNWEYPSPQQMYNAMRRKGYVESNPGEAASIVNMVEVHNFLNEGAWGEILGWEREFGTGEGWLGAAKRRFQNGGVPPEEDEYQGTFFSPSESSSSTSGADPRLLRFQGRSQEPTPKARILQLVARFAPNSRFATPPPFDRHDWYVQRSTAASGEKGEEVRYVIDYYAGDPEPTGEPVFYLDVRPALDRPGAVMERAVRWGGEVWWKASGAVVRERERRERERRERMEQRQ